MIKLRNNWLLPSLGALLLWGVSVFLPKIALQRISSENVLFYSSVGGMFIAVPILFFLRGRLEKDKKGITIAACSSGIGIFSSMLYYYVICLGPVATITTITAMYPVITLILARIFLKDKINRLQFLAICMAIASIALLSS